MVLQMEPKSAVLWGFGESGSSIEINYEDQSIATQVNGNKCFFKKGSINNKI